MTLQLGKAPARPEAVTFKFSDFVNTSQMAAPPSSFGHEAQVKQPWGMLGNDTAGDCVFAGAGHEIMLWNAEAGRSVDISTKTALLNYSKVTGYNPNETDDQGNNPTDQGTDVAKWLATRRKVGFLDDHGQPHKIGAYVALDPGNPDQLRYAAYYFDGVGVGVNFPQQWMDIFQQGGRLWSALRNPNYVGGHYIPVVAWRDNRPVIVSWGETVQLSIRGYSQVCDEAYAYLTPEKLVNGVDAEGINYPKLTSYLSQLKAVR